MKRKGWLVTVLNQAGKKEMISTAGATVQEAISSAATNGRINTIDQTFMLLVEQFQHEDETCDMCHLSFDLCNCEMISPDPHPHLVLVSQNTQ